MNKKYDPVIDFASFRKWQDDFNRGIKDVVDSDSREQMGRNVGDVLTRSLDAIFEQVGGARQANWQKPETQSGAAWSPLANAYLTDAHYVVEVELAGISIEDVDVEIRANVLSVSGERKAKNSDTSKSGGFRQAERAMGTFHRGFELPADCDTDDVAAQMENGLLTIKVGLVSSASARTIKVSVKPG